MRAILHTANINGEEITCLVKFTFADLEMAKRDLEKELEKTGDHTMRLGEAEMIET